MKQTSSNIIIKAIACVSAFLTLCGATAFADAVNAPFLQVDVTLVGDTPQAGFVNWPLPAPSTPALSLTWTTNFPVSNFINTNVNTPQGPVTVTVVARNVEVGAANAFSTNASGWYTNFPTWQFGQQSPDVVNRATLTSGTNFNMLNDFVLVQHWTPVGFGGDQLVVTFSGLTPNTNYEVTAWCYDPNNSGSGGLQNRVAWGVVNPDPGGTNEFQPSGNTNAVLVDVTAGGPAPTTFYGNSGSFFITTDGTGAATVYGYEDDVSYNGTQFVPLNGFSIGFATNLVHNPGTNAITTVLNPVPASYGPPAVWPYFSTLNISDTSFAGSQLLVNTNSIIGQTFIPTHDFMLRNFYLAGQTTTNTGLYTLVLYDLGVTNMVGVSQFAIYNQTAPSPSINLLSHPSAPPGAYWIFSEGGTNAITNSTIIKFKLPSTADEVYLTNGHSYFLGLQFIPGSGSNDLTLEETTSGASTYANGAAFAGVPLGSQLWKMTNGHQNLIMAFDVQNPNPVITVSNYPLTASTTSWPTLPGMLNGGLPVITAAPDTPNYDPSQGANPSYLDFTGPNNGNAPVLQGVNLGSGVLCNSMSFYNTNSFRLGAVALEMRGIGSSNLLFTLNVFHITNTFFTSTTTIEHWPRNFQPSIDSAPLGVPIFGTNVDFYYTTNNNGGTGTSNQLLVLTLPPQYQEVITGSMTLPYQSYVVEISCGNLGQNVGNYGVFLLVRNSVDSEWQSALFPASVTGNPSGSAGFATNAASGGSYVEITPMYLTRATPDPELFAGGVVGVGNGTERSMQLALYAAPNTSPATHISITSVTHSGSTAVLNWTSSGGSSPTFTVWRSSGLNPASWTSLQSGISASTYTDTSASSGINFYKVSSP
ncbi:MAG TPA: hypothetical protein VMA35_03835 [Candidatus Sulfopaludibacter sp.]|nr:hypothetical protein [Candidatus Sulfopaludibacter sp.]